MFFNKNFFQKEQTYPSQSYSNALFNFNLLHNSIWNLLFSSLSTVKFIQGYNGWTAKSTYRLLLILKWRSIRPCSTLWRLSTAWTEDLLTSDPYELLKIIFFNIYNSVLNQLVNCLNWPKYSLCLQNCKQWLKYVTVIRQVTTVHKVI